LRLPHINHVNRGSNLLKPEAAMQSVALRQTGDLTVAEAKAMQQEFAAKVERQDRLADVRHVAGIDVAPCGKGMQKAAAVVLCFPGLELIETVTVKAKVRFPYIPGLLSFREMGAALAALQRLRIQPDLLLCDGHGIAHPRRFGLASHLGVLADLPAIGVAKSRLIGTHEEPAPKRGNWTPLVDNGEIIGSVLRTRTAVRPVYVSIGHRVSLETGLRLVLSCTRRFRLPETTRAADRLSRSS
jgi:deoxyribonuclease V